MEENKKEYGAGKEEVVTKWLEKCPNLQMSDDESDPTVSSVAVEEINSESDKYELDCVQNVNQAISSQIVHNLGAMKFENSTVHFGHKIYLNGSIYLPNGDEASFVKADIASSSNGETDRQARQESSENDIAIARQKENSSQRQKNLSDGFMRNMRPSIHTEKFRMFPRKFWLAQPAMDTLDDLPKPAPLVIICHTATEPANESQAETILMIRNIQMFHIESKNFDDIGYNFLIGSDGNIYEGRGFDKAGAHTFGYNKKSVGIAFVGCWMRNLPPEVSLLQCKTLIEHLVVNGHVARDYKLVAHCQCIATQSPGRALYEEIQTWDHFSESLE